MKRITLFVAGLLCVAATQAQIRLGDGQLTGSVESNSIVYIEDKGLSSAAPEDRFGSNNYIKVDYNYKRLSAGVQGEAYLPALQGYEIGEQNPGYNFHLASKYIQWQDKNFSVLVGDIFDQYGNGLIYRSFEDRQLGFNNSIEGVRAAYNFGKYVSVKGMYGRPRLYGHYVGSWVRGGDVSVSLSDIIFCKNNPANVLLTLEGSYVNRHESLTKDEDIVFADRGLTDPNLNMYSGRLNLDVAGVTFRGEYVYKSNDLTSPAANEATKGQAIYAELGYNYKNFSFSAMGRALDNMGTVLSLYGSGTGNALNYLPALTRQYTYMLANLNPYQVNNEGEVGAQADVYYSYRSKENRYRYWNFHANFSTYYTLHPTQSISGKSELLWRDINFDVERQWGKKLKTSFLYSMQTWNPYKGIDDTTCTSNIFVVDVQYKFDRKKSLRAEVQYLLGGKKENWRYGQDEGHWIAGLVEFNLAPSWSFYVSDMYNFGLTKKNYYNAGFSYSHNRTRVQLSYGRNRAGYICSGGVCRYSPEYTGVNLVLTSSF